MSRATARRVVPISMPADLAVWLWTILVHGMPGRPYNVGSPDDLSIGELAHAVAATLAPGKAVRIALPPRPDVLRRATCPTRLARR